MRKLSWAKRGELSKLGRKGMLRSDERGISSVIVAVSLVGIFGAAVLSLDFGSMWSTRRTIVTGTDSTALDQAIYAAKTGATDCIETATVKNGITYQAWTEIMQVNTEGFEFVDGIDPDCEFYAHPSIQGAGYVQVQSRKLADTRFGALLGLGDTHPYSMSAARIGYPDAIKGLRPIGICVENDHYQEWWAMWADGVMTDAEYANYLNLRNTPGHPTQGENGESYGSGVVHHMTWNKDQPGECGSSTPGNWGWLDFNGGNNSANTLAAWILSGYDGLVNAPGDCNNDGSPDQCAADPGAQGGNNNNCNVNTVAGSLACLQSSTPPDHFVEFPIVVYDTGSCTTGGGNTCSFNPLRYLWVRLWGFEVGGQEADRYMDLEFVPGIATGVCCDPTPDQGDVKMVVLCDVDHDNSGMSVAERCGQ